MINKQNNKYTVRFSVISVTQFYVMPDKYYVSVIDVEVIYFVRVCEEWRKEGSKLFDSFVLNREMPALDKTAERLFKRLIIKNN